MGKIDTPWDSAPQHQGREAGRILTYRRAMSEDGGSSTEALARAATDKEAMKEAMAELLSELPAFRALLEDKGRRTTRQATVAARGRVATTVVRCALSLDRGQVAP